MEKLTKEQKEKIAVEMLNEHPIETIGTVALCKIAIIGISTEAESTTFSTEATIEGKRYSIKGVVTWDDIK